MKKSLSKKLALKRATVTNLEKEEMNLLNGGDVRTEWCSFPQPNCSYDYCSREFDCEIDKFVL